MHATLTPSRNSASPAEPLQVHDHGDQRCSPAAEARLSSDALLRGHKSVVIEHNGASYRLQATKLGKLILTK